MDNQQNLPGTPAPGNDIRVQNAGATTGNAAGSRIGASNTESPAVSSPTSSRKSAGSTGGQSASGTANPGAANSNSNNEGRPAGSPDGTLLDTALQSGKKWIEDSGVLDSVNQLPQSLKDLGNRAVARVGDLTTTQKVVGGTLLAVGLGWLATRKGKSSDNYNPRSSNAAQGRSSYGRNYGYQAPNANRSGAGRQDSGSPYSNNRGGTSSYNNGGSYNSGSNYNDGASANLPNSRNTGSDRTNNNSDFGSSFDHESGARTSESSYRSKNDDFRGIE